MVNKKPWGKELDEKLRIILDKMIEDGYSLSPISRSVVQKRLGIKSRSTLLLNNRAELIDNARLLQLKNVGLDKNGKKKRKNIEEQLIEYKNQVDKYKRENENLYLTLKSIMYNLDCRGLDVEEIMKPLR